MLNLLKVSITGVSNSKARLVVMRSVDTVHISLSWDSSSEAPNCTTSFLNPWWWSKPIQFRWDRSVRFGLGSFVVLLLFYFDFLLGSEVIYLPVVAEVA